MLHRKAHDRDVVKMIPNLADDLAEPCEPVVPVYANQPGECAHQTLRGAPSRAP